MADYFTNFSIVINLASKKQQAYALDLAHNATIAHQGDELPANFPEALKNAIEDWQFETEAQDSGGKHGLWLHSTYGGVELACLFIQHLLEKFDPKSYVAFQWSHDCSKPRTDAYGGGAAFVTAQKIKTISTGDWLQKQIEPAASFGIAGDMNNNEGDEDWAGLPQFSLVPIPHSFSLTGGLGR